MYHFSGISTLAPPTGDVEYKRWMMNTLQKQSCIVQHDLDYLLDEVDISVAGLRHSRSDKKEFDAELEKFRSDNTRKKVAAAINAAVPNKSILILQHRPVETGCILFPEELMSMRSREIKIILVIHEVELNAYRPTYIGLTHNLVAASDVIFTFNEVDKQHLQKHAWLTRVCPMIPIATDNSWMREPNVICFGIIRENKGIEEAIDLAIKFEKNGMPNKVIIIGYLSNENKWFSELKRSPNAIIIPNPTDGQLEYYTKRCRYAYKYDNKGFANNSSSIINLMAAGCIVYCKADKYTPSFVTSGRFADALRFMPTVNDVFESITKNNLVADEQSVLSSRALLDIHYNSVITVQRLIANMLDVPIVVPRKTMKRNTIRSKTLKRRMY